jgi:organic hydroperoxide reductase OsmC/OhrA
MLWYLHLCEVGGVSVVGYRDSATGVMDEGADGSGEFTLVTLRPTVEIVAGNDPMRALAMHAEAHKLCYIARSVKFPVDIVTEIREVATVVLA